MNPVPAGLCADVNDGIAGTLRLGEKDFLFPSDAQRQRIDERILRIARLETDLAADGGNTEAVAVVADAANYAVENATICSRLLSRGGVCITRR